MPAFLKRDAEAGVLAVHLSGYDSRAAFDDALQRVRNTPGRRYNPDTKNWEFEDTADNALRLMTILEPVADAAIQQLVREHRAEVAEALITRLAPDARLDEPLLNHALFPYQRAFVDWAMTHPHAILADDMGIGKTVQAFGAIREAQTRGVISAERPALVVCPNPIRDVWFRTITRGPRDEHEIPIYEDWPGGEVQILNGANVGKRKVQLTADVPFFVVNWEKLRSDAELLRKIEWGAVIADEAHRAKNRKAQQTQGLWKLHAPLQLALTGTPIMNGPHELWAILKWLRPEQYTSYWTFHYSYVDDYDTKYGRVMRGIKNADGLRFELADKLVRRTKAQVLPDLPEKLPPQLIHVELTPAERRLYKEAQRALFVDIAAYVKARVDEDQANESTYTSDPDTEGEALMAELEGMPLDRLQGLIPNGGARITRLRQITSAAKARVAIELIRDNPTEPVVTFAWYVDTVTTIATALEKDGLKVGTIAGTSNPDPVKREFQAGGLDQLVATIAKGGEGIDLYRSNVALFVDEDWVPDRNRQAVDRLHRQGQKSPVSTIILRVRDSVDDGKVAPANRFKRAIQAEILGDAA